MVDGVIARLAELVLMPVIEIPDPALAVPLADALIDGGLPCAEITFRTAGAAEAIQQIARQRPELLLGAGTVRSAEQVDSAIEAGATFLVSPGTSPPVVQHAIARGVPILPGICTPTELEMALALGADVVKFFPAQQAGGAGYLRALIAPYPSVRFVPTGGISTDTLADYLRIGQVAAVGGSWMAPRQEIAAGNFAAIATRVRQAVQLVRQLRPDPLAQAL
ncbi:MAG TPA: bifunctional 4-hydroxy-2-oxoglutarate aldolase/2-dehydro-3-deoxy-phosphogluconate aldolase [Streptosporangiaceae bacterium]|nr:bifunctional 4-hydroxy-2-oxoglutarate aldolase/2-dehydro-3-deoxy-phosphogluconate aldolase [Streptosporangiaceae bacterium]